MDEKSRVIAEVDAISRRYRGRADDRSLGALEALEALRRRLLDIDADERLEQAGPGIADVMRLHRNLNGLQDVPEKVDRSEPYWTRSGRHG